MAKHGTHAKKGGTVTKAKAKTIMREGKIKGKPLTKKQRGFFGARAGGAPVKPAKKSAKKR